MFNTLTDFAHSLYINLVPTGFISGGLTIGYTKVLDQPLLNILPDPSLLSECKDVMTILSLGVGVIIMILNFLRSLRKKKDDNKETPS